MKVSVPAHLHTGNFDLTGDLGRLYGTVGFAIDVPILIKIKKSSEISANEKWAEKFTKFFVELFGLEGLKVEVESEVIPLTGMGYVTSVALGIGFGASKIAGKNLKIEDLALLVKRGLLTALGLYAFKFGGFIVEGGFKIDAKDKMVPPLLFRGDVPENWNFVVVVPEEPAKKIIEMREKYEDLILSKLKKMPAQLSSELSRIVLMKIIPSFIEKDLKNFVNGLWLLNSKIGDFWSEYQGSRYCSQIVEKGISVMLEKTGCGCQSSWGPTFYTVAEKDVAKELAKEMVEFLKDFGGGKVFCTKANNKGATYD
ncbi:MAG: hypothetical protein N3D19_06565 [Archaeoglobaceae archaeon]|nr:hypothetical protein [Archaeoglobaceae archaeon]